MISYLNGESKDVLYFSLCVQTWVVIKSLNYCLLYFTVGLLYCFKIILKRPLTPRDHLKLIHVHGKVVSDLFCFRFHG